MIYLTEEEKRHKESYLVKYNDKLVHVYRKRKSLSDFYWYMLGRFLRENTTVLDLGAGKKGMLSLFSNRNITTVGLDVSLGDLKKNKHLTYCVCGDAHHLPFKKNSFHFIVSQWLLEHLPFPRLFFWEASRVLRKKGFLLVVSNSLFCPLMFFNALMPGPIRNRLKKAFLPKEVEEDTFPTYYRANTRRRLRNIIRDVDLEEESFIYASDLSFFIFNRALFAFWLLLDRLVATKFLRPLRMHFLALYKKCS